MPVIPPRGAKCVDLVTIGSYFDLLTLECPDVGRRMAKCDDNPLVEQWADYWSEEDGFSSKEPPVKQSPFTRSPRDESTMRTAGISPPPRWLKYNRDKLDFDDRGTLLRGGAHAFYFANHKVIEALLR
jgi:hypothetical protein